MALKYLADTSVLTRARSPQVRETVRELLLTGEVARSSMTDLELGFFARNGAEWDALTGAALAFREIPTTTEDFTRARQVQRTLAERGLRGRKVPDLLIAATAERAGLTVLHYDHDFEHIAAVTNQPHHWVVPAGAID